MRNRLHILFRYILITLVILAVAGAVVYHMVRNTIIDAEHWNKISEEEMATVKVVSPKRGNLLSDDGRVLATNLRFYTMRIDYTSEQFREKAYRDSLPRLIDSLAHHFPQRTRAQWEEHLNAPLRLQLDTIIDPALKKRRLRSWKLLSHIPYDDVARVKRFPFFNINQSAKTGLVVEPVIERSKPFGDLARRSIGIVAEDSTSSEKHGRSGLEGALDSLLYGTPGLTRKVTLTRNAANWTDVPAIPGYDVRTTINIEMQDIVESELLRMLDTTQADWGVAVLMEVATGDIKAISNLERRNGRYTEGLNRAVQPYEPGSVVKPLSMLIALEDGIVSRNNLGEIINIHGGTWAYPDARRPIKDTHRYGSIPLSKVICYSSNIATAQIIMRRYGSNPPAFTQRLASIGFLEPMNAGIQGETTPRIKENPSLVDLSRMAYGYTTAIPPLYTLSIYNAIANGGRYVRPRLYTRLERPDTIIDMDVTYIRDRICSPENAATLRQMLHSVVWEEGGTARILRNNTVELAGKTGTCYMIEGGHYNTSKKRLAFCGFFPYQDPRYSCIVLIANPRLYYRGAASSSGQVMRNIALKMHARGWLGQHNDFTADTHPDAHPRLYAGNSSNNSNTGNGNNTGSTNNGNNTGNASGFMPTPRATRIATPRPTPPGTVPAVYGLSLRDAVRQLEDAGYNVDPHGHGYVSRQQPAPGDTVPQGTTITLTLTQDT